MIIHYRHIFISMDDGGCRFRNQVWHHLHHRCIKWIKLGMEYATPWRLFLSPLLFRKWNFIQRVNAENRIISWFCLIPRCLHSLDVSHSRGDGAEKIETINIRTVLMISYFNRLFSSFSPPNTMMTLSLKVS